MHTRIVHDGVVAGSLGATGVALWFLLIDLFRGDPFFTPVALGRAFFSLFGAGARTAPAVPIVLGYTALHFLAFIAAGLLVAVIVQWAETEPTVLAGALILFVVFELGFHALLSAVRNFPVLGELAWYNVAIGNLVAAAIMGTYMWRTHPEIKDELRYALESHE
jgi:hypothetical protein